MRRSTIAGLSLLSTLAACSSGSDGGTVLGLAPPPSVSVVEPVESPSTLPATASNLPPNSPYVTDPQFTSVYDPSLEPLELINRILCAVQNVGATELVNEGPYIAQIDFDSCGNGGDAGASDPGSAEAASSFQLWTVRSDRASNGADQQVYLWIPPMDGNPMDILVDMAISRGAGDGSPLGIWSMSYAGVAPGDLITAPSMLGSLATVSTIPGLIGFQFYEVMGDVNVAPGANERAQDLRVSVAMESDLTTGVARIRDQRRENYSGDTGILDTEFHVAFDDTHFLREIVDGGVGDGGVVYHRDQFSENVWRYGLYHNDGPNAGERVVRNAGFGIQDVQGNHGYVGYYGLWGEDDGDFSHGATVTRNVPGSATPETYTMFVSPGKLRKYSRQDLLLTDAGGYTFEWGSFDAISGDPMLYLVEYDTMTMQWIVIGERGYDDEQFTAVDPAEVINTATEQYLHLWSQALGGNASYVHGETFLSYFTNQVVGDSDEFFGTGTELELFGFVQCLDTAISGSDAEAGDVYMADAPDVATPHRFEFDRADLTLRHDTDGMGTLAVVGLAAGQEITSGPNQWGMQSGPLVTSTAGFTNVWDVWNATEFYQYETGPNEWNRFVGVQDLQGALVEFDPPLTLTYTHTTANDRNDDATYDGFTYLLQYNGFGDLGGLPYTGVDLNGDMEPDRYYPEIALEDGVTLGASDEYIVKALEIEQSLLEDGAYAGSLALTNVPTMVLPDPANWVAPTNGDAPVVTDPPKVIDGELQ